MELDVVKDYTWNILKKQLQKFKISSSAVYSIVDNVKEQLYSIIANWNDVEFRNAILIIGSEEGHFYEPKNELVANMVVIAIRNSLLEGVSSDSYKEYGSLVYLQDSSIKIITSAAIEYFSKVNLEEVAKNINLGYDFYREVSNKYPTAMKALRELAKCTENEREHEYLPLNNKDEFELEELIDNQEDKAKVKNVESGIEATFNESLCSILRDIKNEKNNIFLVDCFKMCTRNFEKLLKILEFVLTHDAIFVTCNYLITKDYVSRRKDLLKASNTVKEFLSKINLLPEVSGKYKDLLEKIDE